MNCYFLSEIPCFLKVNGEYAGVASRNLTTANLLSPPTLVEFLPLSDDFSPVYSFNNSKRLKPLKTPDGYLFYPLFKPKKDQKFKVVFQKNFSQITLTVTEDNGVKFYIDGSFFFVGSLSFSPLDSTVDFYGNYACVSFKRNKTAIFIFDSSCGKLEFSDVCDEFSISDFLTVKKRFSNLTKTTIVEKWQLSSPFKLISIEDEKERGFRHLNNSLLPLAFFENAIIGASLKEITTANFFERTKDLKEFLGKVLKVVQSPIQDNAVWLIGENALSSATLSFNNGLVDNIFIDDF